MEDYMAHDAIQRLADEVEIALRDPMPPSVTTMAQALWDLEHIDAELATLVEETLVSGSSVRDPSAVVDMTFRSPAVDIEVDLARSPRRIEIQLVPPRAATLQAELTG